MNVFLDTMIYLHCLPIEQIDFCNFLGASTVQICVSEITIFELDKHKDSHRSEKIRERARNSLKFLENCILRSHPVRNGVSVAYVRIPTKAEMHGTGLDSERNDDVLIASIVEFSKSNSSTPTLLITHDTGPRLKCHTLGIETTEIPAKYRLPPELDERDLEIQRLKRENASLQNTKPVLKVLFNPGLATKTEFEVYPPIGLDEKSLEKEIQWIRGKHRLSRDELNSNSNASESETHFDFMKIQPMDFISVEASERYNAQLELYLIKHGEFKRQSAELENLLRRSFVFDVVISNEEGSLPANDVDVILHFPPNLTIVQKVDLDAKPIRPTLPKLPKTVYENIFSSPSLELPSPNDLFVNRAYFDADTVSSFEIRETRKGFQVSDHFDSIKHGTTAALPSLALTFDLYDNSNSFSCEYELTAANLRNKLRGQLHFIVQKVDRP